MWLEDDGNWVVMNILKARLSTYVYLLSHFIGVILNPVSCCSDVYTFLQIIFNIEFVSIVTKAGFNISSGLQLWPDINELHLTPEIYLTYSILKFYYIISCISLYTK